MFLRDLVPLSPSWEHRGTPSSCAWPVDVTQLQAGARGKDSSWGSLPEVKFAASGKGPLENSYKGQLGLEEDAGRLLVPGGCPGGLAELAYV